MNKKAHIISNFIYTIILIFLLYIAMSVVWQSIIRPEEIPDIFGYKIFMILDRNMQNVEYGDLVFTKNIDAETLEIGDIVAFRDITQNKVQIIRFTKEVPTRHIEGLLIKRIPKIGETLYFIQQPLVMIAISAIILVVGGICIYIAGKWDDLDAKKAKAGVTNNK